MDRKNIIMLLTGISISVAIFVGCHASADDPAGQAEELSDPVRRENAVDNLNRLYTQALSAADNDRSVETITGEDGRQRPGPKAIADASIEALVQTYVNNPDATQIGERILRLLVEMQDPRSIPALIEALEWRAETTENHAIAAAQALERMEIPDDQKGPVIEALSQALDRVQQARGIDNRMRIGFIRALGALEDRRATPILTKIATRINEDQNFLINRMAAEELGTLSDPAAVDDMIKGLFLFAPNRPDMRMNDVAAQALVQIGRPAYDPLVATLRGENEVATRIATNFIGAVRQVNEEAAGKMDPETEVVNEACRAIGQLGFREGIDPLMSRVTPLTEMSPGDIGEEQRAEITRAVTCVTSLVQLNRVESDTPRLRQALIDTYGHIPEDWPPEAPYTTRLQIIAGMQHTFDPGLLDFLHDIAGDRDALADFRAVAFIAEAMLAGREQVARLRSTTTAEPEGGQLRTRFEEFGPALDTAQECGDNLQCYIGKLADDNAMVVRKAAYMIARYGRGNADAIAPLIEHLDHDDTQVRGDVLYAIDWIATSGSAEAVAEIDRIREAEEGRSSWNQVKELAMAVRARLQARTGG
ncbi:MAG: hypothetical protein RLO52_45355 [Sandaracinaceae bacterium]